MPKRFEKRVRFNLLTGVDTLSSQTAQDPETSRVLTSLIPSLAGDLQREFRHVKYLDTTALAAITNSVEFQRNNGSGSFTRHVFVATATKLYKETGGAWVEVTAVGTLTTTPAFVTVDNLLHMSDGTTRWIFDGTTWVKSGFETPAIAPVVDVTAAGLLNITSNRYHWFTWADETAGRTHESTSSLKSAGTGAITSKKIKVRQQPGTATCSTASTSVSRTNSDFQSGDVGRYVYVDGSLAGTINSVAAGADADATLTSTGAFANNETVVLGSKTYTFKGTLTPAANEVLIGASATESHRNLKAAVNIEAGAGTLYGAATTQNVDVKATSATATTTVFSARYTGTAGNSLTSTETCGNASFGGATFSGGTDATATLTANSLVTKTAQLFLVAPTRATHWHIYASEAEASNIGFYLASVAVTTMEYEDESPFIGTTGSIFNTSIERPLRNDPAPASQILAVHKRRIFGRRETFKNFVHFTAAEEVSEGENGRPEESVPGANDDTLSDVVNEFSFPDESDEIRGLISHGDSLYMGTEDEIAPLYGDTFDNFVTSEVTSFRVGLAGRLAWTSTPRGLAFVTYDKKIYLYPAQGAVVGQDITETLIELGRPKRPTWETMDLSNGDNVRLQFYNYGKRNWLALCFKNTSGTYETHILDYEAMVWFKLSRGVVSLNVFEVANGKRVLVGGGSDGFLWVLDDRTSTYTEAGNYPAGQFRPALIDFLGAEYKHIFKYVEWEVSNENLPVTVTYWLDPLDVDSPGTGIEMNASKVRGANLYRAFVQGGGTCNRLLLSIDIAAGTVNGNIRGLVVAADKATSLIF